MRGEVSGQGRRGEDERGVLLIIVATLLFVFFMFAALALDLSQMSASQQQGTNYAKFSALSALQAYVTAPRTETTEARLALALAAANNNSGKNIALDSTGGMPPQTLIGDGSGSGPWLDAGKYYAVAPENYCANPCSGGQSPPCFVALDDVQLSCEPVGTSDVQPNAFRVHGNFLSSLRSIFARVFTSDVYSIAVDEIAILTPRRGILMVDISDSMFRETHNVTENPQPAYYSYYLSADNTTTPQPDYDENWNDELQDDRSAPVVPPPAPSSPEYTKVHYRSDYRMTVNQGGVNLALLTDADYTDPSEHYGEYHPEPSSGENALNYSASQVSGIYRVDAYRDANYLGPEPFNTVFQGLNWTVEAFKERAVTGDMIGLIFFDTYVTWPRIINLTSDFDYVQRFTDLSITNDPERGLLKVMRHGIFPMNVNKSNLGLAISEAMTQFSNAQSSSMASVDFMVYFGDGLSNCVTTVPTGMDPNVKCADTYVYYRQAMTELRDFSISTLYPRKIPFHIVLAGSAIRPHVLALSDGNGGCLTDSQARADETEYVRGDSYSTTAEWRNAFWGASSATPFYQVNADMYQVARITGGVWGPLMQRTTDTTLCNPPCLSTDPATAPRIEYSCDTTVNDVNAYIEDIMGANPYTIVPKPE